MKKDTLPNKNMIFVLLFMALTGCANAAYTEGYPTNKIGWLHGNCLAISNPAMSPGQKISIIVLGDKQETVEGLIVHKTTEAKECYALSEDRKDVNLNQGNTFYLVSASKEIELGIGLVDLHSKLNDEYNNQRNSFGFCSTSEGVQFSVWEGAPYHSKKLWDDYYYFGYDTEANCPEGSAQ